MRIKLSALPYIFLFALVVRIIAVLGERLVGMGVFFHPDSYYYIETARGLFDRSFDEILLVAIYNEFYVFLVSLILSVVNAPEAVVMVNIIIGAAVPALIYAILARAGTSNRTAIVAGIYFSLLPYHVHLSANILKDSLFLLFSLKALYDFERKNFTSFFIFSLLTIANRLYLGAVFIAFIPITRRLGKLSLGRGLLMMMFVIGTLSFISADGVIDRRNIEFEGRDFFPGLQVATPDSKIGVVAYALFSPIKNLFSPNLLQARSVTDLLFGLNILAYQLLIIFVMFKLWSQHRTRLFFHKTVSTNDALANFGRQLIYLYVAVVTFSDLVTPAVGPLVRYRELGFILLAIAMFVTLDLKPKRPEIALTK